LLLRERDPFRAKLREKNDLLIIDFFLKKNAKNLKRKLCEEKGPLIAQKIFLCIGKK